MRSFGLMPMMFSTGREHVLKPRAKKTIVTVNEIGFQGKTSECTEHKLNVDVYSISGNAAFEETDNNAK